MEVGSGSDCDGSGGLIGFEDFDFSSLSFLLSFSSDFDLLVSGFTISTILLSFPDFDDFEDSDCTSVFLRTTSISVFEFFFLVSRSEALSEDKSSIRFEDLSSLGGLCIRVSGLSCIRDLQTFVQMNLLGIDRP